MNFSIQTNAPKYHDAVLAYIRHERLSLAEGLRFQGAKLGERIITLTPPKSKTQGKAAVNRDVQHAIRPIKLSDFPVKGSREKGLTKRIREYIRERNYGALQEVFAKVKGNEFYRYQVVPFDPEWHRKAQASRGRVQRQQKVATPDADKVKEYIRGVQEHVGEGKGGWAEGVLRLDGRVAGWVAEHRRAGEFVDKASNPINSYILFRNNSEWAEGGDEDRIVANAIASRTRDIVRFLEKTSAKAKTKAGLN